jgi:adenine-specific DNA methylase
MQLAALAVPRVSAYNLRCMAWHSSGSDVNSQLTDKWREMVEAYFMAPAWGDYNVTHEVET